MKQFIWMLCGIFLSGLLLGTLTACGADQFDPVAMVTGHSSEDGEGSAPEEEETPTEEDVPDSLPETDPQPVEEAPADKDEARRLAYGKVLWDAYLQGVLPGGTPLDRPGGGDTPTAPIEGNQFAIADVDGDGEEELLLSWINASMAGSICKVFGYNDWTVREKLSEFPNPRFYDNGAAEADWSHNQGLAGEFWPFNAYRYDPERGVYKSVGSVDAWDSALKSDTFPHDVDADGDGLVYYLLPPDWDGQYDVAPVDGAEYERWRNGYLEGAEEIEVSWKELTEENIAALGAPKPDVEYPEPLG